MQQSNILAAFCIAVKMTWTWYWTEICKREEDQAHHRPDS